VEHSTTRNNLLMLAQPGLLPGVRFSDRTGVAGAGGACFRANDLSLLRVTTNTGCTTLGAAALAASTAGAAARVTQVRLMPTGGA
jgi:hypothetical protein